MLPFCFEAKSDSLLGHNPADILVERRQAEERRNKAGCGLTVLPTTGPSHPHRLDLWALVCLALIPSESTDGHLPAASPENEHQLQP